MKQGRFSDEQIVRILRETDQDSGIVCYQNCYQPEKHELRAK